MAAGRVFVMEGGLPWYEEAGIRAYFGGIEENIIFEE